MSNLDQEISVQLDSILPSMIADLPLASPAMDDTMPTKQSDAAPLQGSMRMIDHSLCAPPSDVVRHARWCRRRVDLDAG